MRTRRTAGGTAVGARTGLATPFAALAALALAAGVGCASRGNVGDLDERVSSLEDRVTEVERKLEDTRRRTSEAESTAQDAVRRAEQAEAAARSAADDADASARKVERVFEKSVSK